MVLRIHFQFPEWTEQVYRILMVEIIFYSSDSLKATVENPRGSVEKLSPKESVKGADTVLRGSVRAPKGFSEGKPEAAKPRGHSPQGFAAKGLHEENPSVSTIDTLLGDSFSTRIFNSRFHSARGALF